MVHVETLLLGLDLVGTFVFALSGAMAGIRRRADLFGVMVLAFVAATAGGMVRDVAIGAVPPAALADWRYLAVSLVAGLVAFWWAPGVDRMKRSITLFDAMGLAVFAVSGAQKALVHGLEPVMAALLGMLTAIGGGIARDVLLAEIPMVLRAEIYATAALAGAGLAVAGHLLGLAPAPVAVVAATACFGLRMIAIRRGWRLPVAGAAETTDRLP